MGGFDGAGDFAIERFEFIGACDLLSQQCFPEPRDGAARLPFFNFFARAVGEIAHAFRMRARAVGLAFEQRRSAACAGTIDSFLGGPVDRNHIVAVDFDAGHSIRRRTARHIWIAGRIFERDFGRVLVVLADKDRGQFPDTGQVQAFVKRAVVHRAVTKERDAHMVGLQQLEAISRAGGLENARTDDAARAHQSDLGREQVHAPAAPARAARFAPVKFGKKLARIEALGQGMAMAAMRAEDRISAM